MFFGGHVALGCESHYMKIDITKIGVALLAVGICTDRAARADDHDRDYDEGRIH